MPPMHPAAGRSKHACTAWPFHASKRVKAKALARLAEVTHQAQVLAVQVVAAVRIDNLRGERSRHTQPRLGQVA
jgi:hypothetical protein